jgi:hypothetical protein
MLKQERHAHEIAERVGQRCGCDPFTILMVVIAVIQLGIKCWQINHPPGPALTPHQMLVQRYRENPVILREQLRVRIRREKPALTHDQLRAVTDEMLAQALSDENADDFNALVESET